MITVPHQRGLNQVNHLRSPHIGWKAILDVLTTAPFDEVEDILYETSLALFENEPVLTAQAWACKLGLSSSKLLPALMRSSWYNSETASPGWWFGLVSGLTKCTVFEISILSYFMSFYPKLYNSEELMLTHLKVTQSNMFGLQFGLRRLSIDAFPRTCAWIYASLGLYEEAVGLTLDFDVNLAKEYAMLPGISLSRKM